MEKENREHKDSLFVDLFYQDETAKKNLLSLYNALHDTEYQDENVIRKVKIEDVLYKNFKNKYEGWVLPKGTVEEGEEYKETALREVLEETGARTTIMKYIGKSEYTFNIPDDVVDKDVHWYLMMADSYYSKPQREEYFVDSGYYKYHEAYHLLKFANEKQILEKAYLEYLELKKASRWFKR